MVDSLIRLFEQNIEPTYNSSTTRWDWVGLGIGVISDAISCKVEEERNGKYELVMEYPTTGARFSELQINRILVTNPNQSSDPQGFRIYEITKNMDRTATIYAEHISYQLAHVPILPLSATNCKQALDALFNSANQGEECHFTYYTDKTSTYFPTTSGSVRTGDYEGRSLQLDWSLTSQTDSASVVSWTLKGVGKLANYTNGWVMCGPINLSIGDTQILVNAHNHPNRVQLYEGTIADQGSVTLTHTAGKFSAQINLDCILYYDYNADGRGKVTGSANMTLPDLSGGGTADVSQAGEFKIEVPTSLRSALGGGTGSVLDVYGGEFEWDNLTVKLHSARGRDNGVTIRYGKNLTSLEQEETIANTYTGILPYWRGQEPDDKETADDGAIVIVTPTHILRNGVALPDIPAATDRSGQTVTKDAVYSSNADLYPYKRTSPEDVTEYFNGYETEEEYDSSISQFERFWSQVPMPQDVYNVATELVAGSSLGVPEVNLDVEFVPLWQTEEYRNLAMQESVGLCDVVHVYFEELGVTVSAKVVKYTFDVLLNRYESIELSSTGTLKTSLASTIASTPQLIDAATQETQHFVTAKLEQATNTITGVYGGRMITNKDENGNPYELVFAGDPDSDGTYGNFMRINKEGIGFSTQGYNGPFNSAWTIDGTFDAQQINVINLSADSMTGGTLKSQNYDTSGGTAGFSANLNTGEITAPSLEVSITAAATSAANSYTDAAIQVAADSITSSVTEQIEATEISAKNYADTQDAAVKTYVENNYSTITQTASQISTAVTSAVNNLQIGGRNLLRDTKKDADENHTTYDLAWFDFTEHLIEGEEYTISAKITTSSERKSVGFFHSGGTIFMVDWIPVTANGIYVYTFIATSEMASQTSHIGYGYCKVYASNNAGTQGSTPVTGTGHVDWIQIEKGNKATAWSPAPDDIRVGGTNLLRYTADMSISGTSHNWRASGGAVSISPETTLPVQNVNRALRVTNTGSSTSRVGCAQDRIPGFVASESYTQSCWIRASVAGLNIELQPLWDAIGQTQATGYRTVATTTTSWQHVDVEGLINSTEQRDYYSAGYVYVNDVPAGGWFEICAIKVEQGNKATAWSPNPEDIKDDYNSKFNSVEQNISSLTQTSASISSEVSKKVDTTTYNANNQAISQQISSLSSRIDQTAGSIRGIVSQEISGLEDQAESISNWFDFSVSNFLTIGQSGSVYKTQITNSAFNILHGSSVIGSFSNSGLDTSAITLSSSLSLPPFTLESINNGTEWLLTE